MTARYGIAEWYGRSLLKLAPDERQRYAETAINPLTECADADCPRCPFQSGDRACRKQGGVCSIRLYSQGADGRLGAAAGSAVIVCPKRFQEGRLLVRWLAEIVGFASEEAMLAREVAFMLGTATGRPAGKIDLVLAKNADQQLDWYGLEIQAVYFSGNGMRSEFAAMLHDDHIRPSFPDANRRPDWRSSSAKRLMPQLQVKVPTLRRWGSKMAVAVDRPFFAAIGGPSGNASRDLNGGDVIWLVPELAEDDAGCYGLSRGHWEVLTLKETINRLLAAASVSRGAFEEDLASRLRPIA